MQFCPTGDAEPPREALRFHAQAVGTQVRLDAQRSIACRRATFHDGIVFSQRPVRPGERVALRLLLQERGWLGGLRVGFTRLDPARVPAPSLPPFLCPDLEQQSHTWAAMLPDGRARPGDVVRFWVNRRGQIFAQVNSGPRRLLREGVLMGAPLWAVMDVYGTTKAIELLDPTANSFPTTMPSGLCDEVLPGPKGSCFSCICSPASLQQAKPQAPVSSQCSAGHTAVAFVTTFWNDSVGPDRLPLHAPLDLRLDLCQELLLLTMDAKGRCEDSPGDGCHCRGHRFHPWSEKTHMPRATKPLRHDY
ncbi:hypothetical protein MJG53_004787 [Ovis ammon polii x Ovis aries]|uniref:Uncharacterized protein n=1 Tax=Ovis ammon polii x Ovis aries TaxID=2918886 RepID=A0ACB9VB37_9CETA|nr:hypothetical protein MJG53_004787 [Ovis ammon polii x Ovis aries]